VRVDHERDARGVRSVARGAHAIHRNVQIVEARGAVVNLVFEVDSHRARVDHAAHGFGKLASVVREAGLDVSRDRNRYDASDTRNRGNHFVAGHRLAVGVAD
jgi:hypothetical protein